MVATPMHVADNTKSDFSAPQEKPDDGTESNAMSEAVSNNTLAAFLIGSGSQAYSHLGRPIQSVSPRTASFVRQREEEASFLRQREQETGAEISALNQFIFQAGNLYQGQRLTENEEAQLRDAAEHVGLSMEVVDVLLRHMADPNAMVNYCLRSDDGFARKFKDDPNFTRMMEEGSLSGGFDLSSSVWRVFLLRIVQQFLKEHYMELGDVMHTSSLTNNTYEEILRNDAKKSEYDNRFAQFSNSMRDFTEERKHVSIDSEEAKKARLVAQVASTPAPLPTFREVLEQGDSSSHFRQPQQVREGTSHAVYIESRDDDLDSRPGRFRSDESRDDDLDSRHGRFRSDELSEARTTFSSFSESKRIPGRKSVSSEWGQTHTSMGRQMPGEVETGAQETESSGKSDEGPVSAVKRGLAMFGKGAPSTGTSTPSKPGAVKRTKSASRLSSAMAIFDKEEAQLSPAKNCGPESKSSSKRWSKNVHESTSAKSVGNFSSEFKLPSKLPKPTEEGVFDSVKRVGQEFKSSKWPEKAKDGQLGKRAPPTGTSTPSKPGAVKRTKSASRSSSAMAIFDDDNQGTEQEAQFSPAKSCGPEFKSSSKRWSKNVHEPTFYSAKSVGNFGSEFKLPSKLPKTAEEGVFDSVKRVGQEFKSSNWSEKAKDGQLDSSKFQASSIWPKKAQEVQYDSARSVGSEFQSPFGGSNKIPNAQFGTAKSVGPEFKTPSELPKRPMRAAVGHANEINATQRRFGKDATEYVKNSDNQSIRNSDTSEHGFEDPTQSFISMFKYPESQSDASSSTAPVEGAGPLHRKPDAVDAASGVDEVQAIYSSFTQSSDFSDNDFLHSSRDESDTKAFRPRTMTKKPRRTQRTTSTRTSTHRSSPQFSNNRSYQGTHKHDSKITAQDGNILPEQDTESRNELGTRTALQGWTNFKSNNAIPTHGRYESFARQADKNVNPFTGGSRFEKARQGISGAQSMNASRVNWTDPLPQSPTWHGSGIHALESKPKTFTGVQEFSGVATPTAATVITNASSIDGWEPFESREQKSNDAGHNRRRGDDNLKEPSVEKNSSGDDGTFPSDEGTDDDGVPGRRQRSNTAQIRAPAVATDGGWARFEGSSLSAFDSRGLEGGSGADAISREAEWKYFGLQTQDKSETVAPFIPSDTEKITSQSGKIKVSQRIKDWGKEGVDATPKGGEKLARCVSQVVSKGRDNGRIQPLNPTKPIGQSCYGREDFSVANPSTVHRHANPHRREPLHQEEWSSFPETSWRNQPSHLKAGFANKSRQATVPEQNREEPPPNEPVGTHGSASNQHAHPNSEYQSEWNHAPLERKTVRKGSFDLDEVCKSRSTDPAGIKPQSSTNTDKTDTSSVDNDSVDRYLSGQCALEVRSTSTIHDQNPLTSHSIQGKCGLETRDHPNAQQKGRYQSKESILHARSETPATYPATEQASSLGDWSPGHWQNEENRNIKRLRTDEYSQSRASSFNESDFGLNSIDNLRDERSQESDVSGLNPIQASGTQTTQSLSSGSDFNAMNLYEPTNEPPESAFRAEQKYKPPVHRKELKESSLFTNSGKDLKAHHVQGSDRDGPHIKKGFHHTKPGLSRSNRVEAHFSRIGNNEMPVQETPKGNYGRGTMKYFNPTDEPRFPNQRISGLHGEREVRNDRRTHQPTSEGGKLYDQYSSAFHRTAPPGYNVADAFPHHRDDGSQTDIVRRQVCEEGSGACGGFIETSHRPLNGRAPAQPDIEWIAFQKDHDWTNSDEAKPTRSAKADFDALNAFLDEFQYDGKPLKVKSTRHGPPPDLVENRSSSTLSVILGANTDHEGREETHDLESTSRREDDAPSQVVYPNQKQQLNGESDVEDRGRKYANVNSTSELTASGSGVSDEAEIRAAAELSGIPLDVVDVVLAQAKRLQPDVGQLFSSDGSIYAPNRETGYQVVDGEVVDDRETGYQVVDGEVVDDPKGGDKGVNPSNKSWETAEAMEDCNFGTPRAASTNLVSTSSPCMPEGKTPVRKDLSPTHFRSPENVSEASEDQEPEGATEEEIKLLNRFIEVAASNFDGKRLSAESETRVRAAALKVGLSEVFVDQLIQQANEENSKYKQFEPRSTRSYVQKHPYTPNTQASSRSFEISRAQKEARKANAAAETTFASGCQFWESLTQNLTYWTKPICGDVLDDASSVGLMSAPTLSWDEDASKHPHPAQPRTPAEKDDRRGYV
jgi:hypothetical protein